jgi:hypothetical protein
MSTKHWWDDGDRVKLKYSGEILPTANCCTTDPLHTKPRSKLVLTESSANNCLNRRMNSDDAKHSNVGGLSGYGEQKEELIKRKIKQYKR